MNHFAVVDATVVIQTYLARNATKYQLLEENHGTWVALLVIYVLPDTATQYERLGKFILEPGHEGDHSAIVLRQAVTDECNMTAIAVSHVAYHSKSV